ncbi:hypothetical protein J6590_070744 [Homalodisca vitripennis]|nr:hypothetical protein J6590_070744 [Homalodisca vitripennis]
MAVECVGPVPVLCVRRKVAHASRCAGVSSNNNGIVQSVLWSDTVCAVSVATQQWDITPLPYRSFGQESPLMYTGESLNSGVVSVGVCRTRQYYDSRYLPATRVLVIGT